jgi:nitrate/nitrite transport system ATP-binding protein
MPFLELTNVTKSFSGHAILQGVNLTIERGEFVAIVGYSGSGKTTLISLIAGLLRPDSGTVKLNDLEITAPGPDRGVVFQNYSLLPWLTVYENIAVAVEQVFPNYSAEKKRQHIEKYIAMVNLTPARDKLPRQLSGGMRQRVALARALVLERPILLMDEPFAALDAQTKLVMQEELARIFDRTHKTVIFVTHAIEEAILLGDEVVVMSARPGRIKEVLAVDLPRPRTLEMVSRPGFAALFDRVFHLIREEVMTSMAQQQAALGAA